MLWTLAKTPLSGIGGNPLSLSSLPYLIYWDLICSYGTPRFKFMVSDSPPRVMDPSSCGGMPPPLRLCSKHFMENRKDECCFDRNFVQSTIKINSTKSVSPKLGNTCSHNRRTKIKITRWKVYLAELNSGDLPVILCIQRIGVIGPRYQISLSSECGT